MNNRQCCICLVILSVIFQNMLVGKVIKHLSYFFYEHAIIHLIYLNYPIKPNGQTFEKLQFVHGDDTTVLNISKLKNQSQPNRNRTEPFGTILLYLRTLRIVWSLVRRREIRRLVRIQTMHIVQYRKMCRNNDEISIYRNRSATAPEPEINLI